MTCDNAKRTCDLMRNCKIKKFSLRLKPNRLNDGGHIEFHPVLVHVCIYTMANVVEAFFFAFDDDNDGHCEIFLCFASFQALFCTFPAKQIRMLTQGF